MKIVGYFFTVILVAFQGFGAMLAARIASRADNNNTLNLIRSQIYELAGELQKHPDLEFKRKYAGALPETVAKEIREKALNSRKDKGIWNPIMAIPGKIYKSCIYPVKSINYVKYCKSKLFSDNNKALSIILERNLF